MNEIVRPLLFEGEHMVRMVERDAEPWFVGNDICRALGLANPRTSLERLDADEKDVHTVDTLGGVQEVTVISEPGVYRLVFTSRKPVAERFKRWLAHEVIPAIRKTGGFVHDGEIIPPPGERRPFPDWPLEEMRTKRGIVDECRMVYGASAAQWIWPQLGFPVPPMELVDRGRQYVMTLVNPQEVAE